MAEQTGPRGQNVTLPAGPEDSRNADGAAAQGRPERPEPGAAGTGRPLVKRLGPWFVWIDEYPDEGSVLLRASDAEQAKAQSGMGDVDTLEAQPVRTGGDDVHSLLTRAAAEGAEWAVALPAAIRMRLVGLLCTALIEYAGAADSKEGGR